MTDNTVPIWFRWHTYRPDKRQYKQQSIELEPFIKAETDDDFVIAPTIEIQLPATHEYLANSEAIIQAQLASEIVPLPVLKPEGMVFCMKQFERILDDIQPNDFKPDKDDSNWKDDEDWSDVKSNPTTDDDWSEASDEKADEAWNESAEDWGEE